MVFSSLTFLAIFLPAFLLAYYLLPWRNLTILIFSLAFYAWGEQEMVLVLVASIMLNYGFGLAIAGAGVGRPQLWLSLGVAANLLLLIYFKYTLFILDSLDLHPTGGFWQVALPLGISFFTFQGISYLVDVYRGIIPAQKSLFLYAVFKTAFPQLIAGPIVRYKQMAARLTYRRLSWQVTGFGFRLFATGLASKALIANPISEYADRIFSVPVESLSAGAAWIGATAYTFQIYFDFSGYSLMAIGIGLMMGFRFPRNFKFPYTALSITQFWRQWHMSLSSWFRDYLYIPLGGNRLGPVLTYRNLLIVFVLCGLWHGASWNFVVWGLWHGLFLVLERTGLGRLLSRLPKVVQWAYMAVVVIFGWVFFRAETLGKALHFQAALLSLNSREGRHYFADEFMSPYLAVLLLTALLFSFPLARLFRRLLTASTAFAAPPPATDGYVHAAWAALLFLSASFMLSGGHYNPFIYFRF